MNSSSIFEPPRFGDGERPRLEIALVGVALAVWDDVERRSEPQCAPEQHCARIDHDSRQPVRYQLRLRAGRDGNELIMHRHTNLDTSLGCDTCSQAHQFGIVRLRSKIRNSASIYRDHALRPAHDGTQLTPD